MKKAAVCLVERADQAEAIVSRLRSAGFAPHEISVLFPDTPTARRFAIEHNTKAPEAAVVGASTGTLIGGTIGLLAGIGALAIPGLGPFIAAGPLMAVLSGAAIGAGALGIAGALVGMGIPETEAKQYEAKVKAGHLLLAVHSEDPGERKRAEDVFTQAHAEDISTVGEAALPRSVRI